MASLRSMRAGQWLAAAALMVTWTTTHSNTWLAEATGTCPFSDPNDCVSTGCEPSDCPAGFVGVDSFFCMNPGYGPYQNETYFGANWKCCRITEYCSPPPLPPVPPVSLPPPVPPPNAPAPPPPLVVDKTLDEAARIATIVVVSLLCVFIFIYILYRVFRYWMDEEERQVEEINQVALKRLASMDREARFIQDLEGGMGMDGVDMDDAVSAVSGTSASNSALSAGKLSALSGLSKSSAAKSAMEAALEEQATKKKNKKKKADRVVIQGAYLFGESREEDPETEHDDLIPPELVDELDAVVVADVNDDDFNKLLKSPSLKRQQQEDEVDAEGLMLKRAFKFCATAADAKKAQLRINTKVNVLSSLALMEAGGRLVKKLLNADVQKEAAKLEAKLEAEAKEKIQQTASLAKEAALKSAELAAETARLAKEGQLLDTIKEKTKQTTANVATTSVRAAANAVITVADKSSRVADDVSRLAKGGKQRLDREARKEFERQKREMSQMATGAVSRLREMPTTLADAGTSAASKVADTATPEWLRGVGSVVGGVVGAPGAVVGGAMKGVGGVAGGVVRGVGGVAGGVGGVIVGRRNPTKGKEDSGQPGPSRQRSVSPANRRSLDSYAPPPAVEASGSVILPRPTLQQGGRTRSSVRFGNFEEEEAGGGGVEETPSKTPRSILKKQSSVSSKEGHSLRRDLSREM